MATEEAHVVCSFLGCLHQRKDEKLYCATHGDHVDKLNETKRACDKRYRHSINDLRKKIQDMQEEIDFLLAQNAKLKEELDLLTRAKSEPPK